MERPDVYTVDDLVVKLSTPGRVLSRRSVWEHMREGHIPGVFKMGRLSFANAQVVDEWMAGRNA